MTEANFNEALEEELNMNNNQESLKTRIVVITGQMVTKHQRR